MVVLGGGAVSYERGTPVPQVVEIRRPQAPITGLKKGDLRLGLNPRDTFRAPYNSTSRRDYVKSPW